jgi:hypothetical protein
MKWMMRMKMFLAIGEDNTFETTETTEHEHKGAKNNEV